MTVERPPAPKVLGASGAAMWRLVVAQYEVSTAGEIQMLLAACFAHQRHLEAQAVLTAEGVTVESPQGTKAHPAVAVADRTAASLAKLLRQLRIELPPEAVTKSGGGGGRPAVVRLPRAS